MSTTSGLSNRPVGGLCIAVLATLAGCQAAPQPEARRTPAIGTTLRARKPSRSNIAPGDGDCGLAGYPVSRSTREIVAAAPRTGARSPDEMLLAKAAIDPEGRITHLRVQRVAHPQASTSARLNEEAVDSIKRWRYAPTIVAGKPQAVCADVDVNVDLK